MSLRLSVVIFVFSWCVAFAADAGALYQGVCFPSESHTRLEYCMRSGQTWGDGADVRSSECVDSDFTDSSYTLCKRLNGGVCSDSTAIYPAFSSCEFDLFPLTEMFAALLLLGVVVACGAVIKRIFWGNHEGV